MKKPFELDPKERFSHRVENYVKYRPGYPVQVMDFLSSSLGLTPKSVIVDVGSGTGISAELFLKNGNTVFGVEPNDLMRLAAEQHLRQYPEFHSQKGSSESTGLPKDVADFIVAAQAFHWFEPVGTGTEFRRILKPKGWVILMWNDRRVEGSPFAEAYEALIAQFGIDYEQVKSLNAKSGLIETFLEGINVHHVTNCQELEFDALLGRLASSSYLPNIGEPRFEEMSAALEVLFRTHQQNGSVRIDYDTKIYYSQLNDATGGRTS